MSFNPNDDVKILMMKGEKGDGVEYMEGKISEFETAVDTLSGRVDELVSSTNTLENKKTLWTGSAVFKDDTITLSDPCTDYDYIDFYYDGLDTGIKTFDPSVMADSTGFTINLSSISLSPFSQSYTPADLASAHIRIASVANSTTNFKVASDMFWDWAGSTSAGSTALPVENGGTGTGIRIYKVVGRKITANAEVADIRTGADGTTYQTAGDAVRGQITQLNNDLSALAESKNDFNWIGGIYYDTDGLITNNSAYSPQCVPLIKGDSSKVIYIIPKSNSVRFTICYFSKATGAFVSRTSQLAEPLMIDQSYDYGISLLTVNSGLNWTLEQMLQNFSILTSTKAQTNYVVGTKKTIVRSGWSKKQSSVPADRYVNVKGINFAVNDTITPKSGYQVAYIDANDNAPGAWKSTAITFSSAYKDYGIVIRKPEASEPIVLSQDGIFLTDYIEEDYESAYEKNQLSMLSNEILDALRHDLYSKNLSKWANKKVAFVGDSITYGYFASSGNIYWEVLDDMIGFSSVYDNGVAGCCWSSTSNYGASPTPICQRYSNIPTDCDLVVIFAGTNDWGHNTPIGSVSDTTDVSFHGAINLTINGVLTANPSARLVLITPLHRYGVSDVDYPNDTDQNGQGKILKDYVDAMKESAEAYGIPVIDMFSTFGNPMVSAFKTAYFQDGLHPNTAGHRLLAEMIAPLLETL